MAEELQYLDSLNHKNTLFLIRQPSTGRILTGRRVTPEQKTVYARLLHQEMPYVPVVRDIIREADGQYLILQDYVQGISLEQILAERHTLSYPEAAHIGIQICKALKALHEFGIVHRDVKPANIILAVCAESDILREDIVLHLILAVLVFCIELAHTSPMGRAVFFTGAAVSLIELVAVNSQWINDKHRQQKFRCILAPVQCGRVLY